MLGRDHLSARVTRNLKVIFITLLRSISVNCVLLTYCCLVRLSYCAAQHSRPGQSHAYSFRHPRARRCHVCAPFACVCGVGGPQWFSAHIVCVGKGRVRIDVDRVDADPLQQQRHDERVFRRDWEADGIGLGYGQMVGQGQPFVPALDDLARGKDALRDSAQGRWQSALDKHVGEIRDRDCRQVSGAVRQARP